MKYFTATERQRRSLFRRAKKAYLVGSFATLLEIEAEMTDTADRQTVTALRAIALMEDEQTEAALRLFGSLYHETKGRTDAIGRHTKLFCLYHLAVARQAFSDAAFHARSAKSLRAPTRVRLLLPIPITPERHIPGPAVVASI